MGAYLSITLTFSCQHDQLVGVYSDRLKNRGLRHGSGQKRGVLGTGQARKKGGLRHGSGQKRGVFTAAHTCTGHICECPPPPGGNDYKIFGPGLQHKPVTTGDYITDPHKSWGAGRPVDRCR